MKKQLINHTGGDFSTHLKTKRMHHEKIGQDEIFVGNIFVHQPSSYSRGEYSFLKTIRVGDVAYDIDGKKLHVDYCRPLFIKKSEEALLDRVMTERQKY